MNILATLTQLDAQILFRLAQRRFADKSFRVAMAMIRHDGKDARNTLELVKEQSYAQ